MVAFERKEVKGHRRKLHRETWATWLIQSQSPGGSHLASIHLSIAFLRNERLGSRSWEVRCYHAAGADIGRTLITTPELSDSVNHLLLRAGKSPISSGM